MNVNILLSLKKKALILIAQLLALSSYAQLRQVYQDAANPDNEITRISFYTPSEGFVAFTRWIGYTTDSGRTFTQKPITLSNVDYNGYGVNLTFGFGINGVKAFDKNTLIVYGDYGLVPAILYSTDGGSTFKLVFHSQYDPLKLSTGVMDMIFPQNSGTGYAVDADRILKTTDKGLTWTAIRNDPGSFFAYLEAVDDNNVITFNTSYTGSKLLKTANGGTSWQSLSLPANSHLNYAYFITAGKGWLNVVDDGGRGLVYYTNSGGAVWSKENDADITPFACAKMKFINDSTGFATAGLFEVYKTSDSGKIWEPLPRNNNFTYLGYSFNDIQYMSSVNQLWAGGGHGFLELGTAAGGAPVPRAFFHIDSTNLPVNGQISLVNYSKPGYSFKWLRNDTLFGTGYNASYTHQPYPLQDTIRLIVTNGTYSDTATQYISFHPPVLLTSFSPISAAVGASVEIRGAAFTEATMVRFGGVDAASFTVVSDTLIRATLGAGASGTVLVKTPFGSAQLAGFTFIPTPVISSFTPPSAIAGTTITILGSHFTGATTVNFGSTPASSFIVVSDTEIQAIPSSGSSGDVTVITPGGKAVLPGFAELPHVASFVPTEGSNGMQVIITGTGFNGATTVSFGGVAARSFAVNSSTSLTAIVAAGGAGNVSVTTPNGTSSLPGFTYVQAPVVAGFTPASGSMGSQVVITGANFSATPSGNTVYFGTVRANVTAASATSLTVTVPAGAAYSPISVTTHHLTASSARSFLMTFPNGGSITPRSFAPSVNVTVTTDQSYFAGMAVGDIDGDGKSDIAVANTGSHNIDILRNTSTGGTVSYDVTTGYVDGFESPYQITGYEPQGISLADMDGDGVRDMIVLTADTVIIYINQSTPGNIRFGPGKRILETVGALAFGIGDIDNDGRADLLLVINNGITVLLNSSSVGVLSFSSSTKVGPAGGFGMGLSDMDGDGKLDLLLTSKLDDKSSVLRNTSTIGNVSFGTPVDLSIHYPSGLAIGDVDGDGRPDLGITDADVGMLSIFHNNSTPGAISFDGRADFPAGSVPEGFAFNDMDGDGLPDMVIGNSSDTSLLIGKNLSTPGNISFSPTMKFQTVAGSRAFALCDMDGDGKNDIVAFSWSTIATLRNTVTPEPFISSFTPSIAVSGTQISITGVNFTGVTAVSFGGTPATSFTVVSSTRITATVAAGATGDVAVTNSYGTATRSGFTYGLTPVISSFAPLTAPAGATVTITGTNFSPTAADNIVYFGTVRAVVSSSTATTLSVIVPANATYSPITVTVHERTAYSSDRFTLTFPGAGAVFTVGSFSARQQFPGGGAGITADIDGDGKLDLVFNVGNGLGILRNTSTPKTFSFDDKVVIGTDDGAIRLATGDLDGDGRPDVVTANYGAGTISILRNTSTPGNISFESHRDIPTGYYNCHTDGVTIADIDGDGRPDVVAANYSSHTLSVFRNISSQGAIAFEDRIDFGVIGYPTDVSFSDLDGDGRMDMAASVNMSPGRLSVFRNTSTPGSISFANILDISTGNDWPEAVRSGDFDGDGKPDIVVANLNSSNLSIFRNTASVGAISFAPRQDYGTGAGPNSVSLGDLDGDGRPDFVTPDEYSFDDYIYGKYVSVLKNGGSAGTIDILPKIDYEVVPAGSFNLPNLGDIGDMDNDGRPDIIIFGGMTGISIYRNQVGEAQAPYFTPTTASTGQTVTIKGSGLTGATGISFGGVPAQSFNVVSDTMIVAKVGAGASGDVVVDLPPNSIQMPGFVYLPVPAVLYTTPSPFCQGRADTLISSAIHGNQWYRDGVALDNDTSQTLIVTTSGTYTVTASLNGVTTPSSAGTTVTVDPTPPTPVITANGGDLVSSAPAGNQWYIDTVTIIQGAAGQHYTASQQGDYAVQVTLNGCKSAFSTPYHYVPTTPNNDPPVDTVHIGPNPIGNSITITYDPRAITGLSIQITDLNGNLILTKSNVLNGDRIDVSSLARGAYVIRLLANNGNFKVIDQVLKL